MVHQSNDLTRETSRQAYTSKARIVSEPKLQMDGPYRHCPSSMFAWRPHCQQSARKNPCSSRCPETDKYNEELRKKYPSICNSDVVVVLPLNSARTRRFRLPRQRVRNDAATSHPSGSTGPAISYTVHRTTRHELRDLSAGPEGDGWRRVYVTSLPSIVAPGDRRSPTAHNRGPADWRQKVIFGSLPVLGSVPFFFLS